MMLNQFVTRSTLVPNLFSFRILKVVEKIRSTVGMDILSFCDVLEITPEEYRKVLRNEVDFQLKHLMLLSEAFGLSPNLIFSGTIDYSALAKSFYTGSVVLPDRYNLQGQLLARSRTVQGIINYLENETSLGYTDRILARFQAKSHYFQDPDSFVSPLFVQDLLGELQTDGYSEENLKQMGLATLNINRKTAIGRLLSEKENLMELYRSVHEELIDKFDRIWDYRLTELKNDYCVIEIVPKAESFDIFKTKKLGSRPICLCRQGVFISLSGFLGRGFGRLEELKCAYHGDSHCVYKIHWDHLKTAFKQPQPDVSTLG